MIAPKKDATTTIEVQPGMARPVANLWYRVNEVKPPQTSREMPPMT